MSESDKSKSDKKQPLTGKKETKDSRRREVLKAGGVIASAYAVPEKWKKPVVDSVLLPAHAATSPAPTASPTPTMSTSPTPAPRPTPGPAAGPTPP